MDFFILTFKLYWNGRFTFLYWTLFRDKSRKYVGMFRVADCPGSIRYTSITRTTAVNLMFYSNYMKVLEYFRWTQLPSEMYLQMVQQVVSPDCIRTSWTKCSRHVTGSVSAFLMVIGGTKVPVVRPGPRVFSWTLSSSSSQSSVLVEHVELVLDAEPGNSIFILFYSFKSTSDF